MRVSAVTPSPAPHSVIAFVSAAIEPVPSFTDADASLASGPPPLASVEPALSLLAFALRALGRAIEDADALDALGFQAANPSTARFSMRLVRRACARHCTAVVAEMEGAECGTSYCRARSR